jgi:hypothetical protein
MRTNTTTICQPRPLGDTHEKDEDVSSDPVVLNLFEQVAHFFRMNAHEMRRYDRPATTAHLSSSSSSLSSSSVACPCFAFDGLVTSFFCRGRPASPAQRFHVVFEPPRTSTCRASTDLHSPSTASPASPSFPHQHDHHPHSSCVSQYLSQLEPGAAYTFVFREVAKIIQSPMYPLFTPTAATIESSTTNVQRTTTTTTTMTLTTRMMQRYRWPQHQLMVNLPFLHAIEKENARQEAKHVHAPLFAVGQILGVAWRSDLLLPWRFCHLVWKFLVQFHTRDSCHVAHIDLFFYLFFYLSIYLSIYLIDG